ncbi:Tol-Pal system protein TolB [Thermoflexales bacterium]|nr:Tol-Pal system protein TolB [Thermoflexales bacterium]
MMYRWDESPLPFDPESFGLSVDYLKSPAWSPSGQKIAWAAVASGQFGFGVFDLAKHTAELIHLYPPTSEGTPAPIWSPDGQWLTLLINNGDTMKQELWVVPVNTPQEEHLLRYDLYPVYPVWSPDSRWLVLRNMLFEVSVWQAQPLALPQDAEVVAWLNPTSQ